jgi:hypothetical protein
MIRQSALLSLVALALVGGCNQPTARLGDIPLGPKQTFKGIWHAGFEMSAFVNCRYGYENCKEYGDMNACWLDLVEDKGPSLGKLLGRPMRFEEGFSVYVEFEGRESLKRGEYGHLGEYSCLIEGDKLLVAKSAADVPTEKHLDS